MKVTGADGTRWRVRRQWMGKRVRLGKPDAFDGGGLDFGDADGIFAVLAVLLIAAVVFLFAWFVIALAIELIVILVVLVAGLFSRVVLRRPWTIHAVNEQGVRHQWEVVGWRASRGTMREVRATLEHGLPLPRD